MTKELILKISLILLIALAWVCYSSLVISVSQKIPLVSIAGILILLGFLGLGIVLLLLTIIIGGFLIG